MRWGNSWLNMVPPTGMSKTLYPLSATGVGEYRFAADQADGRNRGHETRKIVKTSAGHIRCQFIGTSASVFGRSMSSVFISDEVRWRQFKKVPAGGHT